MRCVRRNKQTFYYASYLSKSPVTVTDEYGNVLDTGQNKLNYSEPVQMKANISPASGVVAHEYFGSLDGYDKVIILGDPNPPIDEYCILWVDKSPYVVIGDETHKVSHDYVVRRVARNLRSTVIAISKVTVGE